MPYGSKEDRTATGVTYVVGETARDTLERIDPEHRAHEYVLFHSAPGRVYASYGETVYKVTITVEPA